MADSDNSRTLPSVTPEGGVHSGVVASLPTDRGLLALLAAPLHVGNDEFAFAISHEWRPARQRQIESRLGGQGLEAKRSSMIELPPHASEA